MNHGKPEKALDPAGSQKEGRGYMSGVGAVKSSSTFPRKIPANNGMCPRTGGDDSTSPGTRPGRVVGQHPEGFDKPV